MPTRALRRAQKQKDQEALLSSIKPADNDDGQHPEQDEEDEESEEETQPQKQNLFAMLNAGDDDEEDEPEDEPEAEEEEVKSTPKRKLNKKKKKKKTKNTTAEEEKNEDEIDAALKALDIKSSDTTTPTVPLKTKEEISAASRLAGLLKVDSKNLDPDNEMRRLFGRAALNADDDAQPAARNARRGVVPGAHGRGLQAGKRNVFVPPGEGWPPASSGGLGMEIVQRNGDGSVEFKYVHSKSYKDTQRQFLECVVSMDPQRMITHLQTNPYHISTLLQVSTIALTHNNPPDHNSSQILIARALYALGRSSHSTYPTSLYTGIARLSYNHFENRELWYAGWKYIESLSRRGMWRTGLEMAKVLLQMDPLGDPLCMCLCVDQYALKSRQSQWLLDMYESEVLKPVWSQLPNMLYSIPLALLQLGKQAECRTALKEAVVKYPWMIAGLCGALSMDVPGDLWGILPPTDNDKLLSEAYVHRCADIWNIPENTGLLFEVAGRVKKSELNTTTSVSSRFEGAKGRDVYRHVLLMEVRSLLTYLPTSIKSNPGMAWDLLPPEGHASEYERDMANASSDRLLRAALGQPGGDGALGLIQSFVSTLMPWAGPMPERDAQGNVDQQEVENWMRDALRQAAGREGAAADEAWMGNMLELNGEAGEALRREMQERRERGDDDRDREGGAGGNEPR